MRRVALWLLQRRPEILAHLMRLRDHSDTTVDLTLWMNCASCIRGLGAHSTFISSGTVGLSPFIGEGQISSSTLFLTTIKVSSIPRVLDLERWKTEAGWAGRLGRWFGGFSAIGLRSRRASQARWRPRGRTEVQVQHRYQLLWKDTVPLPCHHRCANSIYQSLTQSVSREYVTVITESWRVRTMMILDALKSPSSSFCLFDSRCFRTHTPLRTAPKYICSTRSNVCGPMCLTPC